MKQIGLWSLRSLVRGLSYWSGQKRSATLPLLLIGAVLLVLVYWSRQSSWDVLIPFVCGILVGTGFGFFLLEQVGKKELIQKVVDERTAALRTATESKSRFIATMSHEVRTPMNGIVGIADLIQETALDDRQRRRVEIIQQSSRSLMRLLDEMLDLSKIEANALQLEKIEFSLSDLVEEIRALYQPVADKKNLRLHFETRVRKVDDWVVSDPMRIKQVLSNLIDNSIKFTPFGEVSMKLIATRMGGSQVRTVFEVRDTGIGFSQASSIQLFEPFTQADSSTTRRYGGTGLGLAICKKITALMGGTVEAHGELGVGSVFRVSLNLPVRKD